MLYKCATQRQLNGYSEARLKKKMSTLLCVESIKSLLKLSAYCILSYQLFESRLQILIKFVLRNENIYLTHNIWANFVRSVIETKTF